jgi:hypothetical protein
MHVHKIEEAYQTVNTRALDDRQSRHGEPLVRRTEDLMVRYR